MDQYSKQGKVEIREQDLAYIKEAERNKNCGIIDSSIADSIVQAALLGELVYG